MLAISTHKVAQIILMGHELDRAEGELRGFIETLNEDEQAELTVHHVGRARQLSRRRISPRRLPPRATRRRRRPPIT